MLKINSRINICNLYFQFEVTPPKYKDDIAKIKSLKVLSWYTVSLATKGAHAKEHLFCLKVSNAILQCLSVRQKVMVSLLCFATFR